MKSLRLIPGFSLRFFSRAVWAEIPYRKHLMSSFRVFFGFVLLIAVQPIVRAAETAAPTGATLASAPAVQFISASSQEFVYEGRFDVSDPAGPVVIWQTSRIRVGFDGDAITLRFSGLKGQVFFNAEVDGHATRVDLPENSHRERVALSGYGAGRHQLVLFKRSEANAGTVRFLGVELPSGAKLEPARHPQYAMRFGFIGDSITVGACNEDGPEDQWVDRSTHNAALSYAAMTADAFQADHRNISVSGMGIVTGWVPQRAGETWDRLYPDPTSPRAKVAAWVPNVVFINLGENDNSFTAAHGQPFPTNFVAEYVKLVHAVRAAFPSTEIVILRGGMAGGATSEPLRKAWESVVAQLEKSDARVSHFVFAHWSRTHPRVADDHAMADELVSWLRNQSFLRPSKAM